MKKMKFVSVTLSVALISALGLGGCGGNSQEPITLAEQSKISGEKKQGYNAVSGKVILDETSNSTRSRALTKNQADITAYNLNDNTSYKTTTDASGKYELSGLSDGDYQIFAQNDQYAKNSVQRVTLKKGTRQVVDFTLTAAGSVSGKIAGAGAVYIPGTDHVSIADENGNFALTGIPVGTYVLVYEDDYSDRKKRMEIEVTAGGVTPIDMDSGFNQNSYSDDFAYVNTSLENGVLGFKYDGIAFSIFNFNNMSAKYPDFGSYITLKNSAGEVIPVEVRYGSIKTNEIVPAGEYTLTFKKEISEILNNPIDADRVYTFNVELVSIVFANAKQGSRFIEVNLPSILTQAQKDTLANLKIVEKGTSEGLSLKQVWEKDRVLTLFGAFKTGVEYELQPTDEQSAILGAVKLYDDSLIFGHAKIDDIYPDNNSEDIDITQNLYVSIDYASELDTSTVKFTLNNQSYAGNDIVYNGEYQDSTYYMYQSTRANISFKHDKLDYGTEYNLTFEAKDMSGNTIEKTTTFKTLTPSITNISPDSMEELFSGYQSIEFNIPVDKESGVISIENLTDSSNSAEIITEVDASMYDQSRVYFEISKLAPSQRYKITASGFKDSDGVAIPEKSTEFATPPKMLFIQDQYNQNLNVSGESFNHKVNLFFFGGLSDAEKTALEDNLVVTSYGQAVVVDETHPVRKLFFIEEDSGVTVSVAFTIDPNTNYELALNSLTGLSNIIFPDNTKLVSFSTARSDNSPVQDAPRVIERLSVSQPNLQEIFDTQEPEMKLISDISMDIKIPLGYAESYQDEYGYTQYESCYSKYQDMDYSKIANDLVKESLNVKSADNDIDVEFSGTKWHISEEWLGANKPMCTIRADYSYQHIASFEADYNKTYEVSLDFTDRLQFDGLVSNTLLTQTVKTDPVGTLNFGLYGGMDQDMIMFNIYSNTPMKIDNIDDLFDVKVNGESFVPDYGFDKDEMNATTYLSFPVPRTLYSLLQLELSKVDGQDLRFINPLTDEEVVNNSSLTEPIVFVEDVAPDLLPVKVEEIKTISMQNDQIEMYFNRAVDSNDIATVGDNGSIETIAFEVKANDDTTVAIVDVDGGYDGVVFTLAEELNVSKTYTLSLKDGESIKAAFGAQELKEFSQEIPLTYIEMGEMVNIVQQRSVSNTPENAYMLGSTNMVNATFDNSSAVAIPVNMTEGVAVNVDKSSINVKDTYGFNDILNIETLIYDSEKMVLIQPIREAYDIKADVEIVYTVNSQEYSIDASATPNRVELPYIGSFYGNGADAITFIVENMDYNYQIVPENFVVYNEEREVVDANVSVQFDMDPNQPTVRFENLAPDSVYAVEIVGIPSYNATSNMSEMTIDTIFISTPAE